MFKYYVYADNKGKLAEYTVKVETNVTLAAFAKFREAYPNKLVMEVTHYKIEKGTWEWGLLQSGLTKKRKENKISF